jgi:hypothetical protein
VITLIGFVSVDEKTLAALLELRSEKKLKIRVSVCLKIDIIYKSKESKNDDF